MDFDIQLESSELGEVAFVTALTNQRESLLKRLADAPPELPALLALRAEAAILKRMFRETSILLEAERARRKGRAPHNLARR